MTEEKELVPYNNEQNENDSEEKSSDLPVEIIELLAEAEDEEGRIDSKFAASVFARSERFSGPLPPPKLFAQYKEVMPDAPERILSMAESQQAHRIKMEDAIVTGSETRANWGTGLGFFLFLIMIGGGIYLLMNGYDIAAYGFFVTAIAGSAVNFFLVIREQRSIEKDEKESE